jgi:hypothetical protein
MKIGDTVVRCEYGVFGNPDKQGPMQGVVLAIAPKRKSCDDKVKVQWASGSVRSHERCRLKVIA